MIDLIRMKAIVYLDDEGKEFREEEIPDSMATLARRFHEAMLEAAAETDEELMDKYVHGEEMTE